jgi:maltooligosyltrehalose trehalohydrolase
MTQPTTQMPTAISPTKGWQPAIGAWPDGADWRFQVWAQARSVRLVRPDAPSRELTPRGAGIFEGRWDDFRAGQRYGYLIDGRGPYPDPASRSQPDGVFALSALVDPRSFEWTDQAWRGTDLRRAVIYELHVGTFTEEGTLAAAAARLDELARLGVTAVELMPLADFAGDRNWGYDGVALFATARPYGTPDDLRRFVDRAHGLGLAVLIDVVYNHFGPAGAFHREFHPHYFSAESSPWGQAINLSGPGSEHVRSFFTENALMWLHEFHADGLRLDAVHAFLDGDRPPFVRELVETVRARGPARRVILTAEDERNEARLVRPAPHEGWGLDAVWADDLHHHVRARLAGDRDGYFEDFSGTTEAIADTLEHGWHYRGQRSAHHERPRGTPTAGLSLDRFVVCLQNHDQIGNRAFGDRLHHTIDLAAWRAASVLLFVAPETPLLFMGQEWAASTPFRYFTDHEGDLGEQITIGRRREFGRFAAFRDPERMQAIPDPQAIATFERSRLDWAERAREPHASVWRLYSALAALRRGLVPEISGAASVARALDEHTLAVERRTDAGLLVAVIRLGEGAGRVEVPALAARLDRVRLTTEDREFATDPQPSTVRWSPETLVVEFTRPGAVVLMA